MDVERDEELGSERVSVQVGGESKRDLQDRDQQEAAGGGLPVPTLDLMGDRQDLGLVCLVVEKLDVTSEVQVKESSCGDMKPFFTGSSLKNLLSCSV